VRYRHDLTLAFELGRRAHAHVLPQQGLLVEAIAMFQTKTMDVTQRHDRDVGLLIADSDKPTAARLALGIGRLVPLHADHRERKPGGIFQRHLLPPSELNRLARVTLAVPASTWGRLRGRSIGLLLVSAFARRPRLPLGGGGGRYKQRLLFKRIRLPRMGKPLNLHHNQAES
jgi:hypothetical protein